MLNSSSDLYKTEWLDLVFKNRNKNYGAYALRSRSGTTTLYALLIAAPLFILFFSGPMIYKYLRGGQIVQPVVQNNKIVNIVDLTTVIPIEEIKPAKKEELPIAKPLTEKIKTVKLPSNPIVVNDPVIVDPPTTKDIENAVVGTVTKSGTETNLTSIGSTSTGRGIGNGTADNEIHDFVTIESYPEFEGGMEAWARFIQKNLRYPATATESGTYGKVFVSFVIEKDGSVSNVTLLKGIGSGCDEEALRVIKKSPKWKPGKQNNENVRVRFTIPLSFTINN